MRAVIMLSDDHATPVFDLELELLHVHKHVAKDVLVQAGASLISLETHANGADDAPEPVRPFGRDWTPPDAVGAVMRALNMTFPDAVHLVCAWREKDLGLEPMAAPIADVAAPVVFASDAVADGPVLVADPMFAEAEVAAAAACSGDCGECQCFDVVEPPPPAVPEPHRHRRWDNS